MSQPPDFDPYELLGVGASADAATIDRAYKSRIRYVHPDIAGAVGLDETKRLNVAREWLLDPELRAQLPKPKPGWWARATGREAEPPPARPGPAGPFTTGPPRPEPAPRPSSSTDWYWDGAAQPPPKPEWEYDPIADDPLTFDYGSRTDELRGLFDSIRSLTPDERSRVTYSLGDEPPFFFDEFEDLVGEQLWARSQALEDAVFEIWTERHDEGPPLLFPVGRVFGNGAVVADAYAQWRLLEEAIRQRTSDPAALAALESRCTSAWKASVGHDRYGTAQREVIALLDDARRLAPNQAERLARAWHRDMHGYLYGRPGEDWFPGSLESEGPRVVSARLAAVDASRVEPPDGLPHEHHSGFRYGLRLTAHTLGLGAADQRSQEYLRPWRDALDANPSFQDRARWGMPSG